MFPAERRQGGFHDRRRSATPPVSRHLFRGRRRSARRTEDQAGGYYADVPAKEAIILAAFILALSILDGGLSLHLFEAGKAQELNPLMRLTLDWGQLAFLMIKLGMTLLGLLVLCAHWNFTVFRRLRIDHLSQAIVAFYTGLVLYEITLVII